MPIEGPDAVSQHAFVANACVESGVNYLPKAQSERRCSRLWDSNLRSFCGKSPVKGLY